MTPQELQAITGQHLLFLGIPTYSWNDAQFTQAADFARAHGADTLLVKVADGTNLWYGGIDGFAHISDLLHSLGVGCIPYTYGYGNKFGVLDQEIDILIEYMQRFKVVVADLEEEYNGQVAWASHLCQRMQPVPGTFAVSTWADPSLQDWTGVIAALAPCVTVWCPQQYDNYLASCWTQFGINGVEWLQPTVSLTNEDGANDPVAIAAAAHSQGHTAISVWYYDTAIANPALLDQVYAAFPKQGGNTVQQYSPNSNDFNAYFTVDANGNWICKQTNAVIIGGNKALFSQLSIDGNTLPVIGLPLENEQYHTESDGYHWSTQRFERATMVYDPDHRFDSQPGLGASYLAHTDRYQPAGTIPAELKTRIDTNATLSLEMQKIADGLPTT